MSTEELNISAAVQRYEVSRKTVRRRLAEGAIDGARQVPGDHGPEWVFPAESLEVLGYGLRPSSSVAGSDKDTGEATTGALPFAASPAADSARPRRRVLWAIPVLILGLLLGVVGAGLFRSDDGPTEPLEALLQELTAPGDEIGIVGDPPDATLPNGRVPVPVDELGDAPRYVVVGGDEDAAVLDTLLAESKPILALERSAGTLWLFDTGAGPLPASSNGETTTTATMEPVAGPSIASTTTLTPTVTSIVEDPPATTTPESPPTVEPELSEGDPSVAPPSDEVTVTSGDSFWSIAERAVADSLGASPTDAQITSYWAALIDANVDQLVEAGNADLILPGQVFQLPPI